MTHDTIAVVADGFCDMTVKPCTHALDFAQMARASAALSEARSDTFTLDASVDVSGCHRPCLLSIAIRHREIAVFRGGPVLASAVMGLATAPARSLLMASRRP